MKTRIANALVILGAASRLLPHPPNFTSVNAVGLYGGAKLQGWRAYLVPLVCMLITDPVMGAIYGFQPFSRVTPFIYASLLLNVWLGQRFLKSASISRMFGVGLVASTQFYLITNFATWLFGNLYPHTVSGLAICYIAALPFFAWNTAGTFVYTAGLFGVDALLARRIGSETA
jgi:hypothetical protein